MSNRYELQFNRREHSSPQDYYQFLLSFLDAYELGHRVEVQRNTDIRKCMQCIHREHLPDDKVVSVKVSYYNTDVVTLLPNGEVILNTGNWCTQSTHNRMTNFSPFDISGGHETSWILTPDGYKNIGGYYTVPANKGREYCRHFSHTASRARAKYISLEISRMKRRKLELQQRKEGLKHEDCNTEVT